MLKIPPGTWRNMKKPYEGYEIGLSDIQVVAKSEVSDNMDWTHTSSEDTSSESMNTDEEELFGAHITRSATRRQRSENIAIQDKNALSEIHTRESTLPLRLRDALSEDAALDSEHQFGV